MCKISIFASAHRPEIWMTFYNSIGSNDVEFEVVFVGPNEPGFKLPENFRFIKSPVKPAQCYEIAARNCKGDLLLWGTDDIIFKTKKPLDVLYETYNKQGDEKVIVSCILRSIREHDYRGILSPCTGLISRKLFMELGGIDRNFLVVYWDMDIFFRVLTIGGRVVFSDVVIDEIVSAGASCNVYGDRGLLDSMWVYGTVPPVRNKKFEPFSDDKILLESQGPKDKWV